MSEKPEENSDYHILEQQQPPTRDLYKQPGANISTDLEYTYAKDTNIPRINFHKTAVPQKPEGSGAYHTLEEKQPPATDLYKQPDTNIPIELEYSYAKDTDIPRITVDKRAVLDKPDGNGAYHTLEQEQPPPTDLYEQPDTNTPSELEYSYAKSADIPRITFETTAVPHKPESNAVYNTEKNQQPTIDLYEHPGANIPIELEHTYAKDTKIPKIPTDERSVDNEDNVPATSTGDALYHTLEQEEPASNEQDYNNGTNTDIPSVPMGAHQYNGPSSPPDGSGLYHTLEKPKSPETPVYSTLEKSTNNADTWL